MTLTRAQVSLATVFVVGLVSQIAIMFYTRHKGAIYPDEQTTLISKLLGVYAVHLAVIIGGVFSQQIENQQQVPVFAFWFALVLAAVWNLLLLSRSASFIFPKEGADTVGEYVTYLTTIASASSFLVAAALAFFFTRR